MSSITELGSVVVPKSPSIPSVSSFGRSTKYRSRKTEKRGGLPFFTLDDTKVFIRGLPQRVANILAAGYKQLLPLAAGGGGGQETSSAAQLLQSEAATLAKIGAELPALADRCGGRAGGIGDGAIGSAASGTPQSIVADAEGLLDTLRRSLSVRAGILNRYHTAVVACARKTQRAAREAVAREKHKLEEYNAHVENVCRAELLSGGSESAGNVGGKESEIDALFRSLLAKVGVPCEGVLARTDLPTHAKVGRLLAASDLPPLSALGGGEALQNLPRPRILELTERLRERSAEQKTLLLSAGAAGAARLKAVSEEVDTLREEARREIAKNNARSLELLEFSEKPVSTGKPEAPEKLLRDLAKASVLCHLHTQDERVRRHSRELECDARTEMVQRRGLEAFGIWFTDTFRSRLAKHVGEWSSALKGGYLSYMRDQTLSVEHLTSELRRPRYHTLRGAIEKNIRQAYTEAEAAVLRGHRSIIASTIDLVNDCY